MNQFSVKTEVNFIYYLSLKSNENFREIYYTRYHLKVPRIQIILLPIILRKPIGKKIFSRRFFGTAKSCDAVLPSEVNWTTHRLEPTQACCDGTLSKWRAFEWFKSFKDFIVLLHMTSARVTHKLVSLQKNLSEKLFFHLVIIFKSLYYWGVFKRLRGNVWHERSDLGWDKIMVLHDDNSPAHSVISGR